VFKEKPVQVRRVNAPVDHGLPGLVPELVERRLHLNARCFINLLGHNNWSVLLKEN
jgi:hypothetical protein